MVTILKHERTMINETEGHIYLSLLGSSVRYGLEDKRDWREFYFIDRVEVQSIARAIVTPQTYSIPTITSSRKQFKKQLQQSLIAEYLT